MFYPEVTGPLSALPGIAAQLAGNESALRFIRHRCRRVRRYTKAAILGTFAVPVTIVLILQRLGAICPLGSRLDTPRR